MTTEVIVLCKSCDGKGVVFERVSAYDSEYIPCRTCNGHGRLREITTITYKILS